MMGRLIRIILWLLYSHRRCEAISENARGQSMMQNGLSVYWCKPHPPHGAKRCRNRAVAGVKVYHGIYVALICREHAEMLVNTKPDWHRLPSGESDRGLLDDVRTDSRA